MTEGKIRYGVIQFPILGQASVLAAVAAECAAEQGKFWEYHDAMYEESTQNPSLFTVNGVEGLARMLGLDEEQYHSCVADGRPITQLQADVDAARALGIGSTPTILINDEVYRQQRTFDLMSAAIEGALAGK